MGEGVRVFGCSGREVRLSAVTLGTIWNVLILPAAAPAVARRSDPISDPHATDDPRSPPPPAEGLPGRSAGAVIQAFAGQPCGQLGVGVSRARTRPDAHPLCCKTRHRRAGSGEAVVIFWLFCARLGRWAPGCPGARSKGPPRILTGLCGRGGACPAPLCG